MDRWILPGQRHGARKLDAVSLNSVGMFKFSSMDANFERKG